MEQANTPVKQAYEPVEPVPDPSTAAPHRIVMFGDRVEDSDDKEDESEDQEVSNDTSVREILDTTEEEITAAIAAAAALAVVYLPIASEGLTEEHFIISDRRAFVESIARKTQQQLLRTWQKDFEIALTRLDRSEVRSSKATCLAHALRVRAI